MRGSILSFERCLVTAVRKNEISIYATIWDVVAHGILNRIAASPEQTERLKDVIGKLPDKDR